MTETVISIVKIDVGIQGVPPGLLMASKRIMEAESLKKGVQRTAEQEAELHCHWTTAKKRMLGIPWVNLYKSICTAASDYKYKGQKTMGTLVAATISCEEDMISLGTDGYEVYAEWARIPPRTGAMVKISRPRIREWKASFVLIVDPEMYGKEGLSALKNIIAHAGKMVGIGPWRPQLKGPYGRFIVTQFKIR